MKTNDNRFYEYDGKFVPLTKTIADRRYTARISYLKNALTVKQINFHAETRPSDPGVTDFWLYDPEDLDQKFALVEGYVMHELACREEGGKYRLEQIEIDGFRYLSQLLVSLAKEIEKRKTLQELTVHLTFEDDADQAS